MDLKRKDYFEVAYRNLPGTSVDNQYNIDQDYANTAKHSGTYTCSLPCA
jgi:hypothetical protein